MHVYDVVGIENVKYLVLSTRTVTDFYILWLATIISEYSLFLKFLE